MSDQPSLKPWIPLPGIPDVLYCEALRDDEGGIQIDLSPRDSRTPVLRITFESVIAYQNVNETYRYRTWRTTRGPRPTLLIVEGSSWLSWLREESDGLLPNDIPLVHYAIYTPEDCIDVVSRTPPRVERL